MLSGRKEKPAEELVANIDFTKYEEGIYVGYRHFDKNNLEVSYPFGYGISYSEFDFTQLDVQLTGDTIHVAVRLENTGQLPGKEVVQIYTSKPDTEIDRPLRELKAFSKTPLLNPGESTEVILRIPVSDLSYWNENGSGWTLEEGTYAIQAGSSSRDIRLSKEISLQQ